MHTLGRTSTLRLLISIIIMGSASSGNPNSSQLPAEVNTFLPVLVDTKAVLSCSPILLTNVLLTTWEIFLGDKPLCIRTHKRDTNETTDTKCTDKRMTWLYRLDQIPALQIDPVAITHEGYYRCIVATPDGIFHHGYQLQVLVAPEVTLFQSENRSAVCKAVAGRPAAQISWTPEGDCVPEYGYWSNGTVTVQSTCHWADGNVSIVSCSVFHETGNWSRSIELNPASSRNRNSSPDPPAEVDISLPVLVDTKAVLFCSPILLTNVIMTTWEIFLGDKPPCIRAYKRDTNETTETNCADERMTWLYRPTQIPALQIDPVAITHEGHYRCIVAAYGGNFFYEYQLRVLVAPEVTLFQSENRTAVCKAVAGRPAARISWTPEGDCVPEYGYWSNGTVTVQSMCHWADGNVSIVSCSVFHETGNWSRSIDLNPGARTLEFLVSHLLIILYLKSSIFLVILVTVGIIYFQRINNFRAQE